MLPKSIIEKIRVKYGKERLYSSDCAGIAESMTREVKGESISTSTIKRLLGFIGKDSPDRNRTQRPATLDIIAKWLGYPSHIELMREIGGDDNEFSEFTSVEELAIENLEEGTQIRLQYIPSRTIVMTYIGNNEFIINKSVNSKLTKGDHIFLSHLILEHELIVKDVIRDGKSMGAYRGAKDGGLKSIEIIH